MFHLDSACCVVEKKRTRLKLLRVSIIEDQKNITKQILRRSSNHYMEGIGLITRKETKYN